MKQKEEDVNKKRVKKCLNFRVKHVSLNSFWLTENPEYIYIFMFAFPHQLKRDSNELASVGGLVEVQRIVGTQYILAVLLMPQYTVKNTYF